LSSIRSIRDTLNRWVDEEVVVEVVEVVGVRVWCDGIRVSVLAAGRFSRCVVLLEVVAALVAGGLTAAVAVSAPLFTGFRQAFKELWGCDCGICLLLAALS
jgi:hypothetical protein